MTKVIVYNHPDNGAIHICSIAPEMFDKDSATRSHLRDNGIDFQTEDEIVAWVKAKDTPQNIDTVMMNHDELPSDFMFTDSWEIGNNAISVNMEKARPLWMNHLRALRAQKFIDLGFPYRLNQQLEDAVIDAATRATLKQLRDIPQTYDLSSAKTANDLMTMIPDILK